jgi:hypothetical protein
MTEAWATFFIFDDFLKNRIGLHFWRFFSQTNLVALSADVQKLIDFVCWSLFGKLFSCVVPHPVEKKKKVFLAQRKEFLGSILRNSVSAENFSDKLLS